MLQLTNDACEAVLILTDGLQQSELLRSRLTRAEVQRQVRCLADTLADAPDALRHLMPEMDWAGWRATRLALPLPGAQQDEALWFAVQSLVPATLSWLRVYREQQPGLFQAWH
ncbi:MAG: hypothetical protein Q7T97_12645 [Burkholderiaceae bacterium]|nr:hypothetical protein [Pseudomonadota bacterium]MDO9315384.1 hypothetical protein [Burkholderiaceae bacterium]